MCVCVRQVDSDLVWACVCVCVCKMKRLLEQLCFLKAPLTDVLCWSEWVCTRVYLRLCEGVCVAWRWVTILWLPPGLTERIQGSPGWGHHAQVKVLYLGPGKPTFPFYQPLFYRHAVHWQPTSHLNAQAAHTYTLTQAGRQLSKRGTFMLQTRSENTTNMILR